MMSSTPEPKSLSIIATPGTEEVSFIASSVPIAVMAEPVMSSSSTEVTGVLNVDQQETPLNFDSANSNTEADHDEESTSSAGNILPLGKLQKGWSIFTAMASKAYEEQVKPALAVAAESTSKFNEETLKPAMAVAVERSKTFHQETLKPAWESTAEKTAKFNEETIKPALAVAAEKTAAAWEVTKEKTGEAYVKVKPTLDACGEQCDLGVKKLVALVNGKSGGGAVIDMSGESEAPSVLENSTKGSFTI